MAMPRKLALILMIWVVSAFGAATMAQDAPATLQKGLFHNFNDLGAPAEIENFVSVFGFAFDQSALDQCTKLGSWSIVAVNSPDFTEIKQAVKSYGENNYENNVNLMLITSQFSVPSTPTGAAGELLLRLTEQFSLESYYDFARVRATTDGGTNWIELAYRTGQSPWRESYIDISSLAGKDIRLGFQLTSDGSQTSSGWSIAGFEILRATFGQQVLSANYDNFPAVTVNTKVFGSLASQTIPPTGFRLYEDGVEQSIQSVTKTSTAQDLQSADIIFIIDNSLSMQGKRTAINSEINSFIAKFQSGAESLRFGLCRYGTNSNNGAPIIANPNLSTAQEFSNYLAQSATGGTEEPSYLAIVKSSNEFNFRANAARYFILLTDEGIQCAASQNNRQQLTDAQAIEALRGVRAKLYSITSHGDPCAEESDIGPIARATNGTSFPLFGSAFSQLSLSNAFTCIYKDITSGFANCYRIVYQATDKSKESQRNIRIIVKY